ncbi:MAG: AraC family transcriptional regulator [Mahella sp.]|nr:AraC family transcriptional regulator [Mahella sp.]MDK2902408.1 hypothetical protein [Clostridiales bacterium]
MSILHQKRFMNLDFPFSLWIDQDLKFGAHWHQEVEMVYMLEGSMQIGLNNEIYTLNARDILFINSGDIHYFLHNGQSNKEVVIQFGLSLLDMYSDVISGSRFINPLISRKQKIIGNSIECVYHEIEKQIILLINEYQSKRTGYHMAVKARLYDLAVVILRYVPLERYSLEERTKQLLQLEVLKKIFQYVEEHYESEINLEDISTSVNYSVFYFPRFFKGVTGMTFGHYLRDFRIRKAEEFLRKNDSSISEVAFRCGFNSVKTFNRVFKQLRGCSPTAYKKAIYEK